MKSLKRERTMYNCQASYYTVNSLNDLKKSTDEKTKGDIISVAVVRDNLIDAIGSILFVDYDLNPDKLSDAQLINWAKKLGYIHD